MHGLRLQAADFEAATAAAVGYRFGGIDERGYDEIADAARAGWIRAHAGNELLGADTRLDLEPDVAAFAHGVDDCYDAIEPGLEGGIGKTFGGGDPVGHGRTFCYGGGGGVGGDAIGSHHFGIGVETGLDVRRGYGLAAAMGKVKGC